MTAIQGLGVVAMLLVHCGTVAASELAVCPAKLDVGGSEFLNSCAVNDATLRSAGLSHVYLSTREPQVLIEPLPATTEAGTQFEPELVSIGRMFFFGYKPLHLRFADVVDLPIHWCSIGQRSQYSCVVPAGVYRVSVLYSVADPKHGSSKGRRLCRVFSPALRLREPCQYSIFR